MYFRLYKLLTYCWLKPNTQNSTNIYSKYLLFFLKKSTVIEI